MSGTKPEPGRDRPQRGIARRTRRPTVPRLAGILIATTAAGIVFSAISGAAATLGVTTSSFGADTKVITSCGSGMKLGYTTTLSTSPNGRTTYTVNGIDLSNIPPGCLGKNLALNFYDTAGNDVGLAVDTTLAPSHTTQTISITPSLNTIDANQVSGIAVVVP